MTGPVPPPVRENERVWRVTNPTFSSNTYIVSTGPGECLLVDPGLDVEHIDAAVKSLSLRPRLVFCTHGHFDHIGSASFFQEKYASKVYLHEDDDKTLRSCNFLLMAFKLPQRVVPPRLERIHGEQFDVPVGDEVIRYRATPGHTPGSCVIQLGDMVFTGDTLYSRGMGLSRLPGEDSAQLRVSLRAMWDLFPAGSQIYPGHGSPAEFGWIKENNQPLLRFLESPESPASGKSN